MIAPYLAAAMVSGLIAAAVWLVTGGTFLGALGVYVMTGNLTIAAMAARTLIQRRS